MEAIPFVILALYGLGITAAIILLIVFIIRRIEAKKHETFEDRDN